MVKHQIKTTIYELLYKPIDRVMQDKLVRIIIRNTILGKHTHKSFLYKNEVFNCDETPLPRMMNRLDPSLYGEMTEYLAEMDEINNQELPRVLGFINQVLNSTNEFHDYLKLLPEQVHEPLNHLISACPCRNSKLSDEAIEIIKAKNAKAIDLIKQRMVINLII